MKRRSLLKLLGGAGVGALTASLPMEAKTSTLDGKRNFIENDRAYWVSILHQIWQLQY